MFLENNEKDKERWRENERRIRNTIIWIIIAVIALIVIIVYWSSQIWAIVVNAGVIIGLIADLISIVKRS